MAIVLFQASCLEVVSPRPTQWEGSFMPDVVCLIVCHQYINPSLTVGTERRY